jgi:predicted Holliday junction resolvase-like endonuclease
MSTGTIVVIVVAALILIAIFAILMPRLRARREERLIEGRRQEVAEAHREHADTRMAQAEMAEREARAQRAEAELHQQRAEMHQRGMADEDLEQEHGRFVRGEDDAAVDERTGATRRDDTV